jgi:hypothetical protein
MLRKTVLVRALSIAFSAAAIAAAYQAPAMAQSNAAGSVFGTVTNPAGSSVQLRNAETGLKRSIAVDASGRFQATALPIGHYVVELTRDGKVASTTEVDVVAGQGADASFATLQSVQVTARRSRIDVSNTNNGAVFTAKELARLPIASNLTAIALLAPNTTRADSAFLGTASFGGGGASENAFYVNGFPITNPLTQLGSMQLPFGAIAQASVITGGFGAEFGRSIGGVMSMTTKSGTNNWETGGTYSITPDKLRSKTSNIYYPKTGYAANMATPTRTGTDGLLHFRRDNRYENVEQFGAYLGGPIITDKLFMFVAADNTVTRKGTVGASTSGTSVERDGWNQNRNVATRYTAKFDWNLTDAHRLELTMLGDDQTEKRQTYGYELNGTQGMDAATLKAYKLTQPYKDALARLDGTRNETLYSELSTRNPPGSTGAQVMALKYTGNLTDDLTLTSMYGVLKGKRGITYTGMGTNLPPTIFVPGVVSRVPALDAQGLYKNYNKFPGNQPALGEDQTKSFRLDLEYKLGKHTLRAGMDSNKLEVANAGVETSGGAQWSYLNVGQGLQTTPQPLSGGRDAIIANYGGYGVDGFYAQKFYFKTITGAKSSQNAQYLEDRFQVSKNLLITAGIRNEGYTNSNGDGEKFIDMKNQTAPRLSASWDVKGDATLKVYGSAGRYYLQLPTSVAARASSRSTYLQQDFTYTGIDAATGAPTGLNPINTPYSAAGEYGNRKDQRAVVSKNLKPNYQDELTLGFEKAYNPDINFGAKVTLRELGAGIDDTCDTRRSFVRARELGIEVHSRDFMNCYIFNPGDPATVWLNSHDANGIPFAGPNDQYTTFTAAELGYPKAERSYRALDMFLEHPLRGGWYGKLNYTLSRSYGNMEGQTRSDTQQSDVGTSAAWDFPEFLRDSVGLLPNDRKHQIKAYGFYEISPQFSIAANLVMQSGRPKSCMGTNVDAERGRTDPYGAEFGGPGYGPEYFYCSGKPVPRGSLGRMPWEEQLDLSFSYTPAAAKDLLFKIDAFNVLNTQHSVTRREINSDSGGVRVLSNYGEDLSVQTSRTIRLTVEFNHKF